MRKKPIVYLARRTTTEPLGQTHGRTPQAPGRTVGHLLVCEAQ